MDRVRQRPWRPVLDGALGERARSVVDDVAAVPAGRWLEPRDAASLACGGGSILLDAYRALVDPEGDAAERALARLNAAIGVVASEELDASLYGGFTGVAWMAQHLKGRLAVDGSGEVNEAIDEALIELLERDAPWRTHFDLVSGLVGFGVYALERMPHPSGRRCLEGVVRRLGELAEPRAEGLAWRTTPGQRGPQTRQCTDAEYNLGVAHGVPGVIGLLAGAAAAGVETARSLAAGAVSWLLAQRRSEGPSAFANFAYVEGGQPSRAGWCYGDPGIACTLLAAARVLREPTWEREALAIAYRAAVRPAGTSGVVDHGLCHGSAGLALLFHRLFDATGEEVLGEAARDWYRRALDGRKPGEDVAGYPARIAIGDQLGWRADPGLLTGAAGVALALLAGYSTVEPAWDRVLLASLPHP